MGYLNRENETKDVIVPGNSAADTNGNETAAAAATDQQNWLKLGDLGFVDEDGFLVVLGRPEGFVTLNTKEIICPAKVSSFTKSKQAF